MFSIRYRCFSKGIQFELLFLLLSVAMACGSCKATLTDDVLRCKGVCERFFHATLKCSGVKADLAKTVRRNDNIQFVCSSCRQIGICDVLQAVKICNEEFIKKHNNMQEKLDELITMSSSFLRRTSLLECSVNDAFTVDCSRIDDDILSKLESVNSKLLNNFLARVDHKLQGIVTESMSSFHESLPTVDHARKQMDCVRSINSLLSKIDSSVDAKDLKLENLSENLFELRRHIEKIANTTRQAPVSLSLDPVVTVLERLEDRVLSLAAVPENQSGAMSYDEILTRICAANDQLRSDMELMEIRTSTLLHEVINKPSLSTPVCDSVDDNEILSPTSVLLTDDDVVPSLDVELEMSGTPLLGLQPPPIHDVPAVEYQWIYVASADDDFCLQRLKNLLYWNFGIDNFKIDLLSKNPDVTYKSFKIAVPLHLIQQILNLKNWPRTYYVRRFDAEKKTVFRQGQEKDKQRKTNFVHNPLKLRI